jgi:hypothetical protein
MTELPKRRKMSADQKAAWRGSVLRSNNKPASGLPASGLPAIGKGWGGPARGAGKPFEQGHPCYPPREDRKERAELAMDKLFQLAMGASSEGVQMLAAEKYVDRVEGRPRERAAETPAYPPPEEIDTRDPNKAAEHYERIMKEIG